MVTPQLWLAFLGSAQQRNSHTGQLRQEHETQEFAHTICWAVAKIWGLPQTITVEGWTKQAQGSQQHQDVASVSPSFEYGLASPASQR